MRHTLQEITKLEALCFIVKTRNVGHSHMYKYNTQNKVAMLLKDFNLELAFHACQKLTDQENSDNETQTTQEKPS
ncbi:MAG: hypothetical protein LBC03_01340 [Nitrososphaerota archaeon]|nr:hypothetical protein [Nitrososphaerota archaeon]